MVIRFEAQKVIQAAAVLLKKTEARRMTRLRLLKLLYIADRESLAETEAPITGDRALAMDHGPVLEETYRLIKGETYSAVEWQRHFNNSGQDVVLTEDPGVDALTRYDIRKLQEVAERFEHVDNDWDVAEATHLFEEWLGNRPPSKSCNPIPLRDILAALGMEDLVDEIVAEEKSRRSVDRALAHAAR